MDTLFQSRNGKPLYSLGRESIEYANELAAALISRADQQSEVGRLKIARIKDMLWNTVEEIRDKVYPSAHPSHYILEVSRIYAEKHGCRFVEIRRGVFLISKDWKQMEWTINGNWRGRGRGKWYKNRDAEQIVDMIVEDVK